MIKATPKDKAHILEILTLAFSQDPQTIWLAEPADVNQSKRIRAMMNFAFEKSILHQEVYLSKDRQAVAIWLPPQVLPKFSWGLFKAYLHYIWYLKWHGVKRSMAMKNRITQHYPKDQEFWYLWIIGVRLGYQGLGLSSQLIKPMLQRADEERLPVYLETSTSSNAEMYQRKGFEVFEELSLEGPKSALVYMMKRMAQ